jgi:hypothetical protein
LLADTLRYAAGHGVRNTPRHTLRNLDGLLVANWLADRVANCTRALLWHHVANLVATGVLLRNHVANLVADRTRALLRNHVANLVAAALLLWDHVAGLPANCAAVLLRNHVANLVAARTLFRNHVANLVANRAATLLGYHVANLVAEGLLLRNHVANLVAAGLGPRFADPLRAANFLRAAFRDPMLLAAFGRRALHTLGVALAWAIVAAARARIIRPSAWLADAAGVRWARDLVRFGFPMSGRNLDRLRVVHRNHHAVVDLAALRFPNWLAHGVAAGLLFVNWLAHGVANFAALRLPARLADRVGASLRFPHRLAHGVANFLAMVFPLSVVNRVATGLRLVAGLADRLANLTGLCFPAWLADRIAERLRFEARLAYGVANFPRTGFRNVLHTVDNAVFADPIPDRFVAGELLLLVLNAVHRFHNGVSLHLTTRVTTAVPRDTAEPGLCFGWDKPKR